MKKIFAFFIDSIQTITVSLSVFAMVYLFLAAPREVQGASMEPNLHTGERLIIEKVSVRLDKLERGQIVVLHSPLQDADYVKRVIGLPRETVVIDNCQITIKNSQNPQGFVLMEEYLPPGVCTKGGNVVLEDQGYIIPKDYYLVLGDNRERSFDGRFFGAIPKEEIEGRAILRFWPTQNIQIF
ncbi:signal peptidase I [Candidatus Microgenomates bacterium]|nr:signal peptidase I [Candidatus Microgenomates bacterium]